MPEPQQPYKRKPLGFLNEEDRYPTEWQVRDGFAKEDWRQLDSETYQVRNPDVVWTLPKEGWEKYNESPFEFLKWVDAHNFKVELREEFDGKLDSSSMPDGST